ncbi:MAG: 3D domain-containing protein [Ndongobacter sp.]|nr:3D domain-containing protein [Ndongobacter sp.]
MDKYSMKRSMSIMALMLSVSVIGGSYYAFAQRPKQLIVDWNDEAIEIYTTAPNLEQALNEAGYTQYGGARISASLDAPVEDGMRVELDTEKSVDLTVGGQKLRTVKTYANTMDQLFEEQGISVDGDDEVYPARTERLTEAMSIRVDRVETTRSVEKKAIPFETEVQKSDELVEGETKVLQEGRDGVREIEYETVKRNGVVVSREAVKEKTVSEPKTEKIQEGTAKAAAAAAGSDVGSASAVLTMSATAYTHTGNPTATGAWPQAYYTVATDPDVIPMGTRLYVEGYGYAVAQDTGGAIIGNRIDLFMDSEAECVEWGVRPVTVYILD